MIIIIIIITICLDIYNYNGFLSCNKNLKKNKIKLQQNKIIHARKVKSELMIVQKKYIVL